MASLSLNRLKFRVLPTKIVGNNDCEERTECKRGTEEYIRKEVSPDVQRTTVEDSERYTKYLANCIQ